MIYLTSSMNFFRNAFYPLVQAISQKIENDEQELISQKPAG